ncbi:alpha/beta hydrolase family protein [Sphingomonas sp.]|uniref:alpha/beta hydrolase family protein n=1 Tax=Sphingomonas sp. TaxID=28214 RepID=UPI00345C372F
MAGGLVHNSPTYSQSAVLGCVLNQCPREVVQLANPIAYIDASDRNTSFLIAHGDADTAVGWRQSQIFYDALRAQGVPAELSIVPGAGHYWEHASADQTQRLLAQAFSFFDEKLKP